MTKHFCDVCGDSCSGTNTVYTKFYSLNKKDPFWTLCYQCYDNLFKLMMDFKTNGAKKLTKQPKKWYNWFQEG